MTGPALLPTVMSHPALPHHLPPPCPSPEMAYVPGTTSVSLSVYLCLTKLSSLSPKPIAKIHFTVCPFSPSIPACSPAMATHFLSRFLPAGLQPFRAWDPTELSAPKLLDDNDNDSDGYGHLGWV
ncbi:hypothetical protein JZ751_009621 [Albula glossodonta]|uniref:Uncharacterized protein n=1 Tax=Albula glossodonta TaxID=121402 RepID=A0A8T2P048_9TELE|nr:hypothetical protein JZ751_009621 [Albula glossodonta]